MRGEDRRASIVDAARGVFARTGYHGASTADIAAAAGCSEPTLYKYFPSKQALFAAVLVDSSLRMRDRFDTTLAGVSDPVAAIGVCSKTLLEDPVWRELVRVRALAITLADDPTIREALDFTSSGFHTRMTNVVRAAQAAGTVRDDVDADAVGWLAVGFSLIANARAAVEGEAGLHDMGRVVDTLITLLNTPKEAVS
jgi:AcrR family transcriptional regulator